MAVTRTKRVLSVLAAISLAFAPAMPAAAQPDPSTDEDAGLATPPPLPPDFATPVDNGEPDRAYTPKTQCVASKGSTAPLEHKPWGQDLLRFEDLSDFATGKGQKVAVIDTGVSPHDYFQNRLEGGGDYVIKPDNGLKDCDGHGTEVAGIIAADPRNEAIGFRGIAPAAGIVSIRQSSANYEFKDPTTNQSVSAGNLGTLAKAIVRAANTPGVTVINMSVDSCRPASLGGIATPERQVQAALRYAVEERNVVPVASAGNLPEGDCKEQNSPDPKNPTWLVIPPWFSEYVLSVAAMTEDGSVAEFSITGPWVSVAAPGTEIISLDPANATGLANQTVDEKNNAQPIQGTSFAAPYVAGLAALVRERFPQLNARQVMDRIMSTASHPAATGGRDNLVGHGMINPMAALTAFIPAEENIAPDKAIDVPFEMPPPYERNWTPMQVAMIGSGGGVGLLLLTLFVVRTARRNRPTEEEKPRPRT
ncbi:MAG: type VII secretion-associated serine protease mycosin [Actinophytocola sp.]|uniref:type VII secretion-associated serine protease mycosin n=1 Tax=Actinophytocola sp. TaxID=1872138 RepID=UPI003C7716E2